MPLEMDIVKTIYLHSMFKYIKTKRKEEQVYEKYIFQYKLIKKYNQNETTK